MEYLCGTSEHSILHPCLRAPVSTLTTILSVYSLYTLCILSVYSLYTGVISSWLQTYLKIARSQTKANQVSTMSGHISYHSTNASHTATAVALHYHYMPITHHWPLHLFCGPRPSNIVTINTPKSRSLACPQLLGRNITIDRHFSSHITQSLRLSTSPASEIDASHAS
jgi:hypothetical protein